MQFSGDTIVMNDGWSFNFRIPYGWNFIYDLGSRGLSNTAWGQRIASTLDSEYRKAEGIPINTYIPELGDNWTAIISGIANKISAYHSQLVALFPALNTDINISPGQLQILYNQGQPLFNIWSGGQTVNTGTTPPINSGGGSTTTTGGGSSSGGSTSNGGGSSSGQIPGTQPPAPLPDLNMTYVLLGLGGLALVMFMKK